jgi:hypothetical protein
MRSTEFTAKSGVTSFFHVTAGAGIVSKFHAISGTAWKMRALTPPVIWPKVKLTILNISK